MYDYSLFSLSVSVFSLAHFPLCAGSAWLLLFGFHRQQPVTEANKSSAINTKAVEKKKKSKKSPAANKPKPKGPQEKERLKEVTGIERWKRAWLRLVLLATEGLLAVHLVLECTVRLVPLLECDWPISVRSDSSETQLSEYKCIRIDTVVCLLTLLLSTCFYCELT